MELTQLILPVSIIVLLIFIVWNLLRKLEKLEDTLEQQDEFLNNVDTKFNDAYKRMTEIDRVGSFEADDESGFIFEKIKEVIEDLKNEYTNRP
jgi:hypothetical protein|tara:strand:- start:212 stop:490 length:279 start_codon:yes stop_codon:yes gene_type:complete